MNVRSVTISRLAFTGSERITRHSEKAEAGLPQWGPERETRFAELVHRVVNGYEQNVHYANAGYRDSHGA